MSMYYYFVLFFILRLSTAQGDCTPTTCSDHGPTIRFPFRLRNHYPPHCGYPGFDLSCSPNTSATFLNLPYSVQVQVTNIDYKSQLIHIKDPNNCFPQRLQNLSLSTTPFQFVGYQENWSLFSCPPSRDPYLSFWKIPCLGRDGREVRFKFNRSFQQYAASEFISCTKMFNVPSVPYEVFDQTADLQLKWLQPVCGKCEAKGKLCRLKRNSTSDEIECYVLKKGHDHLVIAGVTLGPFLLLVILSAMYWFYRQKKIKRKDNLKIERFLEDYRALKPARYSYADIKKITNQFKEEVGQGAYGTVYKGQLSNDVYVAVKILKSPKENGEDFINEMGIIGTIHHVNVVRLVGYCADGFRRALIYEFLPNDSLEKFASSDHKKRSLGWKKLLEIAMGIAKGIEYLHQGCDQQILHFGIKPHNILLDDNLNPKISDFGQVTTTIIDKYHAKEVHKYHGFQ